MKLKEIIKNIDFYYKKYNLKKEKVIVAYSGGIDSTSLVLALNEYLDHNIVACYFEHNIRRDDEQKRETLHIKNFTQKYNIKLKVISASLNLQEAAREEKRSLEDFAREKRYEALLKVKCEENAKYIAVAHTSDDQRETQIMRFFQGSFIEGLKGIPRISRDIIRPLIFTTREMLSSFIREGIISFSQDSTNNELFYLRNQVRQNLIPHLREIFPNFASSLKRIEEFSIDFLPLIEERANFWNDGIFYSSTSIENFKKNPKYIVFKSILKESNKLKKKYNLPFYNVSYNALNEIYKIPFEEKKRKALFENEFISLEMRRAKVNIIAKFIIPSFKLLIKKNLWYNFYYGQILLKFNLTNEDNSSHLTLISYDKRYDFKLSKKFFTKFGSYNPNYLGLVFKESKLLAVIDFNTLNILWKDFNLVKLSIFLVNRVSKGGYILDGQNE